MKRIRLQETVTFIPGIRMWRVISPWFLWGPYCPTRRQAIVEWLRCVWIHIGRRWHA